MEYKCPECGALCEYTINNSSIQAEKSKSVVICFDLLIRCGEHGTYKKVGQCKEVEMP